jgi:hypothetical protein
MHWVAYSVSSPEGQQDKLFDDWTGDAVMYQRLLQILFAQDHRFLTLRTEGIPSPVQAALTRFWSDATYEALPAHGQPAPPDWEGLVGLLEGLARGRVKGGDAASWQRAARASVALTQVEPVAGVLVALQAMAAWVGALGDNLFFQPWQGHHPGWHLFPLNTARNLVAAEAIWSARYVCDTATGFIESAKDAPFNPTLRGVIAEYETVRVTAEQIYEGCVDELAWALHTKATAQPKTFRAELAALFWTSGDVLHAELLRPDGPADYLPPYALVRTLVSHCMRILPREPLIQYIWLDMKDRGPFSLRDHRVLFGHINNRFHNHPLHELDEILPRSISQAYAKALIAWMRGHVQKATLNHLFDTMALASDLIRSGAPDTYLRITALATLIKGANSRKDDEQWNALASLAASVIQWADHNGIYEPFDHALDAPFYELRTESSAALEHTLDCIEAYRQANLGYWLSISPPLHHEGMPGELLDREQALLRELRGARFIRLLPHLPSHYGRYGFKIDEALAGPPPGVTPSARDKGLLQFDPFDQELAQRNLREARERLLELYEQMRGTCPEYAEVRMAPPMSANDFAAALNSHRTD